MAMKDTTGPNRHEKIIAVNKSSIAFDISKV